MRSLLMCAALAGAAVTLVAESAGAATLSRESRGSELAFTESDSDTSVNDLDIDYCDQSPCSTDGVLRFRDLGDSITVGSTAGCTSAGSTVAPGTVVSCVRSGTPRVVIALGAGDDRLTTDGGGFPGRALPVPLVVTGGPGADAITGGAGTDTILGGDGNDTLDGHPGADSLQGGAGADTIEARDATADVLDCGTEIDTAFTDTVDSRVGCELPSAGTPGQPPVAPPPVAPPPVVLKQMATQVGFVFFPRRPKETTRFTEIVVRNVPRGSTLVAKCLTASGRRCGGESRKAFTKRGARGTVRVGRFERRYRAGTKVEVTITNPAFITQIKTLSVRRNRAPGVSTRCRPPGSSKRIRCGG